MKPIKRSEPPQLFQSRLVQILDLKHPLCKLAMAIDWSYFDTQFESHYSPDKGSPAKPTRLLVALHYLKHTFNESDESVVARWVENPYWQYFCGFDYFQHQVPLHDTTLGKWRQRIGGMDMEHLLKETIQTAIRSRELKRDDLKRVTVDTTVQEKAISFPTDSRLYYKMLKKLVKAARSRQLRLRQSYARVSKQALRKQSNYARAKQYKRARRCMKTLKTMLGRVWREIKRLVPNPDAHLKELLGLAEALLEQKKDSKDKIYSIHAPEVKCIAKGKAHKRYEFGNKISLATTTKSNWIVGCLSFDDNPYDGHTLKEALEQVETLTTYKPTHVYVDQGYKKHGITGSTQVHMVDGRKRKKLSRAAWRWAKRRSAVEPVIGHTKSDHRLGRNFLKGTDGDRINATLSACGFNLRKLLRAFLLYLIHLISVTTAHVVGSKSRSNFDILAPFKPNLIPKLVGD